MTREGTDAPEPLREGTAPPENLTSSTPEDRSFDELRISSGIPGEVPDEREGTRSVTLKEAGAHPGTENLRSLYPGEYIEPPQRSEDGKAFRHPEEWVTDINPLYNPDPHKADGYSKNCVDCARSVENTWRGRGETAAGRSVDANGHAVGEYLDRSESWYGKEFCATSGEDLKQVLERSGPGSSAIVSVEFTYTEAFHGQSVPRRGAHAFNIVNDEGNTTLVDGQIKQVEDFNGSWPSSGWNPSTRLERMSFIGFDRKGEAL